MSLRSSTENENEELRDARMDGQHPGARDASGDSHVAWIQHSWAFAEPLLSNYYELLNTVNTMTGTDNHFLFDLLAPKLYPLGIMAYLK
ncbi:MAG TPA: hypothetical protein VIE89_24770 [Candidatus Binatia bacterium]|jgi:hypothetical protein